MKASVKIHVMDQPPTKMALFEYPVAMSFLGIFQDFFCVSLPLGLLLSHAAQTTIDRDVNNNKLYGALDLK